MKDQSGRIKTGMFNYYIPQWDSDTTDIHLYTDIVVVIVLVMIFVFVLVWVLVFELASVFLMLWVWYRIGIRTCIGIGTDFIE